jgi:hypothetical protein
MELVKSLETDHTGAMLFRSDRASVKIAHAFTAGSTTRRSPSKKPARMGDVGKAAGCVPPAALLCCEKVRYGAWWIFAPFNGE